MTTAMRAWLMAVRLPTLLIPTIQVATGTGVAYAYAESVNWLLAFYAWLVAVCVTIGTNLINDAIDYEKGGDPVNRFGKPKVINAGLLSHTQVFWGGMLAFAVACAVPLALDVDQLTCFLIVLLCVVCGYCYTGGPYPISYLGLSELFILIFYGGVCVIVPFYAQTYMINGAIILAALQMGLLAIIPNALNNFRDVAVDTAAHKRTLAVRFGQEFARMELMVLAITPFILNLGWLFFEKSMAALMPWLLAPFVYLFLRVIWNNTSGHILNRYFAMSVLIHFFFGILLITGLLI